MVAEGGATVAHVRGVNTAVARNEATAHAQGGKKMQVKCLF